MRKSASSYLRKSHLATMYILYARSNRETCIVVLFLSHAAHFAWLQYYEMPPVVVLIRHAQAEQ